MPEGITSQTISPPILGWNTKDDIVTMDPSYCPTVNNFYSDGSTVNSRLGMTIWSEQAVSANYGSVFELALQDGSRKLLATGDSTDKKPWDVTTFNSAPVDLSSGGSRLPGYLCSAVNFRNKLFIKDTGGTLPCYYWDGSGSVTAAAFVGPSGNDTALFNPQPYKSRLWFCQLNSATAWYGGIDAITGALTSFDFSSGFTQGGALWFVGAVSKTGVTSDNYLVAISEKGEVLLYQGDYSSSPTWGLIGKYQMAPPIGKRSFFYWNQNLLVITVAGLFSVSDVLAQATNVVPLSDKINNQFSNLTYLINTTLLDSVTGCYYSYGEIIILSFPYGFSNLFPNYACFLVMNTRTGGWWPWWPDTVGSSGRLFMAVCPFAMKLMCAGPTRYNVMRLLNGDIDENSSNTLASHTPRARTFTMFPSYNYFGDNEHVKQFIQARPIVEQTYGLNLTLDSDVDYNGVAATSTVVDTTTSSAKIYRPIMGLKGIGKCASININTGSITTAYKISLKATSVSYKPGGTN